MTHDHETIIVDKNGNNSNMGVLLGIIGIVVLLVAVWYFALGPGSSPSSTTNTNNNTVNPPAATEPAPEASPAG